MKKILIAALFFSTFLSADIKLSNKDALVIANRIWINEGAGKHKYLVWWNKGEEFASLGVGHFIWFTKDKPMWFYQAFPNMLKFITKRGAKPPKWLNPNMSCVWNSYAEWKRAKKINTPKMQELTTFLNNTKALQAQFMVYRLNSAYKKLIDYAPNKKMKAKIQRVFSKLLYRNNGTIDPQGAYCLIDYTNFKGDGTLETERYQNTGWGLYQVLEHFDETNSNKFMAFANSTRYILDRLIKVSPPKRNLKRFRKGWFVRTRTYQK